MQSAVHTSMHAQPKIAVSNGIGPLLLEVNYLFFGLRFLAAHEILASFRFGKERSWHSFIYFLEQQSKINEPKLNNSFSRVARVYFKPMLICTCPSHTIWSLETGTTPNAPWWVAEMRSPHGDNGSRHGQNKIKSMFCPAGLLFQTMDAFVVAAVLYQLGFLICLCWWFPAGFWGFGSSGFTAFGHRVDPRTYWGSGQTPPLSHYRNLSVNCHLITLRMTIISGKILRFWVIRIGCLWPQQGRSDLRTFRGIRRFLCLG